MNLANLNFVPNLGINEAYYNPADASKRLDIRLIPKGSPRNSGLRLGIMLPNTRYVNHEAETRLYSMGLSIAAPSNSPVDSLCSIAASIRCEIIQYTAFSKNISNDCYVLCRLKTSSLAPSWIEFSLIRALRSQ